MVETPKLNPKGLEAAHEAYWRDGLSGPAHDAQLQAAISAYLSAVGLSVSLTEEVRRAVREAKWNVMDGFDEASPVIVERASWQRIRAALASSGEEER